MFDSQVGAITSPRPQQIVRSRIQILSAEEDVVGEDETSLSKRVPTKATVDGPGRLAAVSRETRPEDFSRIR
jgi:hypothetical protein